MNYIKNNKIAVVIIVLLALFSGITVSTNTELQNENSDYERQVASLSEDLETAKENLSKCENEISTLSIQLKHYQDQQAELSSLQKDYDELESKYNKLKSSKKTTNKQSNANESKGSGGGVLTGHGSFDKLADSGSSSSSETVYYTPNGKKYHSTEDCPTLSRSKTIYSTTKSDAQSSGLDACKVCH